MAALSHTLRELPGVFARGPAYVRLAWNLWRDHRVPRLLRVAVLAAVFYNLSPIDPIPSFVPVAGQLDDLLILLSAIRRVLASLPTYARADHLQRVGLSGNLLEDDLSRVRAAMIAMLRGTATAAARLVARGGRRVLAGAARALTRRRRLR